MERGLLTGLAAFRWAAWAWMATVLVVSRDDLDHPLAAVTLAGAALAVTAVVTGLLRTRWTALLSPPMVAVELAVGASLLIGDGIAYGKGHAFSAGSQSLGSAWPLAGIFAAGLAMGASVGSLGGAAIGLSRLLGALVGGPVDWDAGKVFGVTSSTFLYTLAGGVAGFAATRARATEREIAAVRAREDVARHLHDGVLQTLAVVQRKATDPDLARLARDQERALRAFLLDGSEGAAAGLLPALRAAAARFEDGFGGRADVVVADDVPVLPEPAVAALAGAVGEALTNAGKHGGASRVTIYAEPDDDGRGVQCFVNDDGSGFDPASAVEGMGLPRSIRGRLADVGGRAEVDAAPGRGAEVRLWVPGR